MPCVRALVFASTLTKTFDKPSLGRQHTLQPDMKLEISDVGCFWCHWTRRRRLQARKLQDATIWYAHALFDMDYQACQVQDNSVSSYEGGEHGHKEFTKTQEPSLAAISLSILLIMLGAQDNDPKRARLCRTAPLTHWSVGIQVQTILTCNTVFTLFYKPQYRPKKSSSARQVGGAFFSPVARSICLPYRASIILDARLLN